MKLAVSPGPRRYLDAALDVQAAGYIAAMLSFADNPATETAPLPVLVAIAGVGWLIVSYRTAIRDRFRASFGIRVGSFVGAAFVGIGGYGWLLIGLSGVVIWIFDQVG